MEAKIQSRANDGHKTFKILVAKTLGFCPGVRRAVSMAHEAAEKAREEGYPVWSLGPIIHNPEVVSELHDKGVRIVDPDNMCGVNEGSVIIRSHGTTPEVTEEILKRGMSVVDATCPYVRRAELRAREMAAEGRRVVIIGDPDHPEVKALAGWAGPRSIVVKESRDVEKIQPDERIGVVGQTTLRNDRFTELVEELKRHVNGKPGTRKIAPTMCWATKSRQDAIVDLCRKAEVVVVVGGYKSANTRRLVEIAKKEGVETYHIERANEMRREWFTGKNVAGVSAGASTPERMVKEVISRMVEFGGKLDEGGIAILEGNEEDHKESGREECIESGPVSAEDTGTVRDEINEEDQNSQEASGCSAKACGEPVGTEDATCEEGQTGEDKEDEDCVPVEDAPDSAPDGLDEKDVAGSGDSESEQAAALALQESELYQESMRAVEPGDVLHGKVVRIADDGVLVDVGYKTEGLIPLSELSFRYVSNPEDVVQVGDEISVYVMSVDTQETGLKISKKRADEYLAWERLDSAWSSQEVLTAEVIQEVKGGLVVDVGLRGFVPASQIERGYVSDLASYVGKNLRLKVLELDRSKNRVILSQRQVLEEEMEALRQETWNTISEGTIISGVVKGITDFGAFVDIGGVDGLLHVSELSWGRVDHPSSVVKEGDKINVMVLRVDREKGRISLGLKQTLPDPWEQAGEKYEVDSVVKGKITRLAPFGAFVELEPGIEGLVHVSELADHRVERPEDVVSVGDEVETRILRVRIPERRISLSIKQTVETSNEANLEDYEITESDPSAVTIGDMFGDLFERNQQKED
jgi:ribosomal protein S1/(E)-4-hydroxy-3-methyl-but-2-enyl pyrophosphate reductase